MPEILPQARLTSTVGSCGLQPKNKRKTQFDMRLLKENTAYCYQLREKFNAISTSATANETSKSRKRRS